MLAAYVYLQSKLMYFPTPFLHAPHATCEQGKDLLGSHFGNIFLYFSPMIILLKWIFGSVLDKETFLRAKVLLLAVCKERIV